MRKIVQIVVCIGIMFCGINIGGYLLIESRIDGVYDVSESSRVNILTVLSAGHAYADNSIGKAVGHDKDKAQGEALGHDKEGKALGHDKQKDKKPKKPKKDKGKGPSLPALPMASSIVLGLGAIGWGRYVIRKKGITV